MYRNMYCLIISCTKLVEEDTCYWQFDVIYTCLAVFTIRVGMMSLSYLMKRLYCHYSKGCRIVYRVYPVHCRACVVNMWRYMYLLVSGDWLSQYCIFVRGSTEIYRSVFEAVSISHITGLAKPIKPSLLSNTVHNVDIIHIKITVYCSFFSSGCRSKISLTLCLGYDYVVLSQYSIILFITIIFIAVMQDLSGISKWRKRHTRGDNYK